MKTLSYLLGTAIIFVSILNATAHKGFEMSDLYAVDLDLVSISTNTDGIVCFKNFDNRELVRDTANSAGITNVDGLLLVYNLRSDGLEVLNLPSQTLIGTPITFGGGISIPNSQKTEVQSFKHIYWAKNAIPVGTLVAGEFFSYGPTNQITDYSSDGQMQFALPGQDTNSPAIYLGHLTVKSRATLGSAALSPLDPR